ncbi:MAG: RagB/SusD family nutrient uptake outer membrane protein [Bacteroidales bacterium]|nr:RagB/SusD family nutrient uptake outer membrane protein [Bacteroidales bacterium]
MKTLKYISIALGLVLATGCIKETFPQGSTQTSAQVAQSSSALAAMVNAIPSSMTTTDFLGYLSGYNDHTDFGYPGIAFRTENMLEDLVTSGENPYYNRALAYAQNQAQGHTYIYCAYFWNAYYTYIKSCTDIISTINPENANPEALNYLGIAHTYRALFYLDLARLFEAKPNKYTDVSKVLGLTVPIVTEETTESSATNNPRVDRETMYEFILSELAKAETYIDKAATGYTKPSLGAIYGLYARTYLEMGAAGDAGAYALAAEYAGKAITTSGKTPLTQDQWEDPANGFNNGASNNAWIWGLTVSAENVGNILCFTAHMASEGTWGYAPLSQISISKRLYEQISDKDFRKHSWLDPAYIENPAAKQPYDYKFAGGDAAKEAFLSGGMNPAAIPYQNIKFRPKGGETVDYTNGNPTDFPLMRVEEMYFIKAEALAGDGKISEAQAVLTDFMKHRITDGSYNCSSFADFESFTDELLLQKRIEFWGEGILIYDYKRLDEGITRGYKGTNQAAVYCYNSEGRSPQWNIVITRGEFQSNKGITDETNNPDPSNTLTLWSGE